MANNSEKTSTMKVHFIQIQFPEIKVIDPYRDRQFVDRVKKRLFTAGYYKNKDHMSSPSTDESIIRLIMKAKGQKVAQRTSEYNRRVK